MVNLDANKKLTWEEIKPHLSAYKKLITKEFLIIYNKYFNASKYPFKWGDEVEFSLFKFDHKNKRVHLLCKAEKFFDYVNGNSQKIPESVEFHREYMSYMVESIPAAPFDDSLEAFPNLEKNIRLRSRIIQDFLDKDEFVLSLTCFPLIGTDSYTWPTYIPDPENSVNKSIFIPQGAIFNDDNMLVGCSVVNDRRGHRSIINVPIYVDKNTPRPFIDDLDGKKIDEIDKKHLKPDYIYMDDGGFGMGCCCLQVTFQAESMHQAKHLYDHLTPITPLILALSASSPVWRGYLANIDARYNVIKESWDDRTPEEFSYLIARYDSVELYLSDEGKKYNDLNTPFHEESLETMKKNNVDEAIAKHYSNFFLRDPILLSQEDLQHEDDPEYTTNFDIISTLVWKTLRLKMPPLKSPENNNIGWRIEFRPCELQLTTFENTAFATFIILLTRAIADDPKINFLVPISKVRENLDRSVRINASVDEKFYFRANYDNNSECVLEEMSMNEIVNGSDRFKGLIPIISSYLDKNYSDKVETRSKIDSYLKLIELRARGDILTPASWMRRFITSHEKYEHNSKVSQEIVYDLMIKIKDMYSSEYSLDFLRTSI